MSKESIGSGVMEYGSIEEEYYERYVELGGIINQNDFEKSLSRLDNGSMPDKIGILQAENMARFAGIELKNDGVDRRIKLYALLRSDVRPEKERYHHSQMSDQSLFVEALRMFGDEESVNKMKKAYPQISFDYHSE